MITRDLQRLKHLPVQRAERIEVISAHTCLECGHVITDHKRAGLGGTGRGEKMENARGERDHCIGKGDTCPCRKFVQPHTFTRTSVHF